MSCVDGSVGAGFVERDPFAKAYVDFFESAAATDVVLLGSEVRAVHAAGNPKVSRALRNVYADRRRSCVLFANEHHRATAVPARRPPREAGKTHAGGKTQQTAAGDACLTDVFERKQRAIDPLRHPVLRAAAWYAGKLRGAKQSRGTIPVVVLSDALSGATFSSALSPGVEVASAEAYFRRFHADDPVALGLYESIRAAREDAAAAAAADAEGVGSKPAGGAAPFRCLHAPHLSPAAIAEGVASGELIEGVLRVSRHAAEEAVVRAGDRDVAGYDDGGVLIPSRTLRNRSFDGDLVAVRLLPRRLWRAAASTSLVEEEEGTDAEDVEEDAGDGEGEEARGAGGGRRSIAESAESAASGPRARVPTGEVVGVIRARADDVVAVIAEAEERDILNNPHRRAANAVLAVPMDERWPKLRLVTRRAKELLGQRLLVRIDRWRPNSRHPEAHVVRPLGPAGDVDTEMASLLATFQIPSDGFSPGALAELPEAGDAWMVPAEEISRRRDLRTDARTVSIDPPGCTDVDDAVSVRSLTGGGWEVGVHIADVSYFVEQGSLLDLEARARGTTVYLVDRRLDMLPALLSENLASLLQRRDRLAVSCVWTLAPDLSVASVWFGRTVIRSSHQLNYYQAQAIVDRAPPPKPEDAFDAAETAKIRADLDVVVGFAATMHARRTREGAVELASAELRFETTSDGTPAEVLTKGEVPMMRVVAELMIAANAAVATRIAASLPRSAFVRRHAPPRPDGFAELEALVAALSPPGDNSPLPFDASSGAALARTLDRAAERASDRPGASELFRGLATRAMSEAQYVTIGAPPPPDGGGFGHYGLALELYTHFTSPIRRYADVVAHRQLLAVLAMENDPDPPGGGASGGKIRSRDSGLDGSASSDAAMSARRATGVTGSLSHAALAPIADHLNERNRASKRAQSRCAELYLLMLLRERPMVEPALVHGVRENGVLVFIPRFHVRGSLKLTADAKDPGATAVLPASRTAFEEVEAPFPAGGTSAPTHPGSGDVGMDAAPREKKTWMKAVPPTPTPGVTLRRTPDGVGLEYAYASTGALVPGQPTLRPLRRVWVQLSAAEGRARGPRLALTLLDPSHPEVRRRAGTVGAAGEAEGGSLRDAMRARLGRAAEGVGSNPAGGAGTVRAEEEASAVAAGSSEDERFSGRARRQGVAVNPGVTPSASFKRHRMSKSQRGALEALSRVFAGLCLVDDTSVGVERDGISSAASGDAGKGSGNLGRAVTVSAGGVHVDATWQGVSGFARVRWWKAQARAAAAAVRAWATRRRTRQAEERHARRRQRAALAATRAVAARRAMLRAVATP